MNETLRKIKNESYNEWILVGDINVDMLSNTNEKKG